MKRNLILCLVAMVFTISSCHPSDKNSLQMAKHFVDRFRKAVLSKNLQVNNGLLEPGFTFRSCDRVLDKEDYAYELKVIGRAYFSVHFLASEDQGGNIRIRMSMYNWETEKHDIIEVILNKEDQQLEYGRVASCPVPTEISNMAEYFVERFRKSVTSKKYEVAAGLLQPNFTYKGCEKIYDKEKATQELNIMGSFLFSIKYMFCEDLDENIRITVEMKGLEIGKTDVVEIILNKFDQQLVSGRTVSC